MTEEENMEIEQRLPYGGLFGASNLIKVIEQMIADPDLEYRPIDLEKLTKESAPTVRASLKTLTSLDLLKKDETDSQHPVYRVNTESKRFIALTFLAYAVLDDRNGTDAMDSVVADYVDSMLQENAQSVGSSPIEANNLGLATLTLSEFHGMSIFQKSVDAVYSVSPEIETIANGLKILNDPQLKK
jgi:hypothetical protein